MNLKIIAFSYFVLFFLLTQSAAAFGYNNEREWLSPEITESALNSINSLDFLALLEEEHELYSKAPIEKGKLGNATEECNNSMIAMWTQADPTLFANFLLLSGIGINNFGNFPNCKAANGSHYFLMMIDLSMEMGLCLPDTCTAETLTILGYPAIIQKILSKFLPFNVTSILLIDSIQMNEELKDYGPGFIVFMVYVGLMIVLCFIGTCVDLCQKYYATSEEKVKSIEAQNKKGVRKVFSWFSWNINFRGVFFSPNRIDKNLDVLNGVRVLSICWVVFGHGFLYEALFPNQNPEAVIPKVFDNYQMNGIIINATLAVDTFFFLSGFVCTLALTKTYMSKKFKKKGYYLQAFTAYLHRYLRLLPVYFITFMFNTYVFGNLGGGPIFFFNKSSIDSCKDQWWENLLYINNWFHGDTEACIGWSWYLDCDFWFFLIMPWIAMAYCFRKSFGIALVYGISIICFIIQIWVCFHHDLEAKYSVTNPTTDYSTYFYVRPYCRILPYFLGVIVAWMYMSSKLQGDYKVDFFERINKVVTTSKTVRYIGYVLGFCLIYTMVFLMYYFSKNDVSTIGNAAYIVLNRPLFVIGIILIFYPIILGKGRLLFWILGSPLFGPPAKLTFGVYMFHEFFFLYMVTGRDQAGSFSVSFNCLNGLYVLLASFLVSTFVTIIFESPIVQLEKNLLQPPRAPQIQPQKKEYSDKEQEEQNLLKIINVSSDKDKEEEDKKEEEPDEDVVSINRTALDEYNIQGRVTQKAIPKKPTFNINDE